MSNEPTDVEIMAGQILAWIKSARKAMETLSETYAVDMQSALIDDIEELCKTKIKPTKKH